MKKLIDNISFFVYGTFKPLSPDWVKMPNKVGDDNVVGGLTDVMVI